MGVVVGDHLTSSRPAWCWTTIPSREGLVPPVVTRPHLPMTAAAKFVRNVPVGEHLAITGLLQTLATLWWRSIRAVSKETHKIRTTSRWWELVWVWEVVALLWLGVGTLGAFKVIKVMQVTAIFETLKNGGDFAVRTNPLGRCLRTCRNTCRTAAASATISDTAITRYGRLCQNPIGRSVTGIVDSQDRTSTTGLLPSIFVRQSGMITIALVISMYGGHY